MWWSHFLTTCFPQLNNQLSLPENINMSFPIDRIIGMIETNRPKPRRCVKFPSGICNKAVKNNHKTIQCYSCDRWIQIGCNHISDVEYECLKTDDDLWHCLVCVLKYNLDNVPFTRCDNSAIKQYKYLQFYDFSIFFL